MVHYHMVKAESEISDPLEIDRILRAGRYASIALNGDDGPYLITLSYGYDKARNCLYFHTAKRGRKLEMIGSDPRACATVIEDLGYKQGRCDHSYRSVVLHGRIVRVQDPEGMLHALNMMIDHLEDDPDPVKQRLLPRTDNFDRAAILRFDIQEARGRSNG
jgi:nitroimidazol reductase NimA-like FMN-containing flavoprotein (pyridoxamine 5'-phosphate oxidase superfamily)